MTISQIPIDKIVPNPWQTRKSADPDHIREIADSIARIGLKQTPTGRELPDGTVQLAFGHNRLAAYRLLYAESAVANELKGNDYSSFPVEIDNSLTDEGMADAAWAENIHLPLTPLDRARSIKQRIDAFGWTHDQAAQHLGLKRSTVSNVLRLLDLPEGIQAKLDAGDITERKATALLALFDLPESLRKKMENDWNDKPSQLIREADQTSSDTIRARITHMIERMATNLTDDAVFDLNAVKLFDASDPEIYKDVERTSCRACPFRLERDKKQYCTKPDCFEDKQVIWKADRLAAASEAIGIPILEDWQRTYLGGMHTVFEYSSQSRLLPQIRQAGCDNLRLAWLGKHHAYDDSRSLKADGHPEIGLVCQKRNGFCTCLKGLEILAKSESAQPALSVGAQTYVPSPNPVGDQVEDEEGELVTIVQYVPDELPDSQPAITQESLKAEADAARRAERQAKKQLEEVMQAAAKVLGEHLQCLHVGALDLLHRQIVGTMIVNPETTAAEILENIAYRLVKRDYYDGRSAISFINELRQRFEKAGISTDGVFDISGE